MQLSKLNQQLTLQHFSDYTKHYQDIISKFPEDVNETDFNLEGRDDYRQRMRAMRMYFDLYFEEWYLDQRGFIDKRIWQVWEGGMAPTFSKAAFQQAWTRIKKDTRFGQEFEDFVACESGKGTCA